MMLDMRVKTQPDIVRRGEARIKLEERYVSASSPITVETEIRALLGIISLARSLHFRSRVPWASETSLRGRPVVLVEAAMQLLDRLAFKLISKSLWGISLYPTFHALHEASLEQTPGKKGKINLLEGGDEEKV